MNIEAQQKLVIYIKKQRIVYSYMNMHKHRNKYEYMNIN